MNLYMIFVFFLQGRGQYISLLCRDSSTDYACTPCSQYCMPGSYVSGRCTGKGRSDTTCSLCRTTCRAGQYIAGRCTGKTYRDVQTCMPCKTCPAGQWPSGVCDGLGFSDTITCIPCRTMANCPNATHYYLSGSCEEGEVVCKLCDAPCNAALYVETQPCANGKNRVCTPKTLCSAAQCPAGFYESAPCMDPLGPKICTPCSSCKASGEYVARACSTNADTVCMPCRSACEDDDALSFSNGIVGSCSSGKDNDAADMVRCVYSATPVAQPCGANEWLVAPSLSPAWALANMSSPPQGEDTGNPLNFQHPFRSDFSSSAAVVAFLGSTGSSDAVRQTVVRVVNATSGALINYVYPRVAFFNRLDFYGSQKDAALYPVATSLMWNATDVMLSPLADWVYLFFSHTYDFIARCKLNGMMMGTELQAGDCSAMSLASAELMMLQQSSSTVLEGCVRMAQVPLPPLLACVYDVSATDTYVYIVNETIFSASKKVLLESSGTVPGLRRPRSPPAWNAGNMTLYYLADIGSSGGGLEQGMRYVTLTMSMQIRSSGFLYRAAVGAADYHSLVLVNRAYLVAANSRSLVSFSGPQMQSRAEKDTGETSIKDLAVRGGGQQQQLLVLVHSRRMWSMYTHCAPCPANSFSPAGSATVPGIHVCKCSVDYYGKIVRYSTLFFFFVYLF